VAASVQVRTTLDDIHPKIPSGESEWHNGYFMGLVYKPQRRSFLYGNSTFAKKKFSQKYPSNGRHY
jgi:hypothetical protein